MTDKPMTMREKMASVIADIDDYDDPRPKHYAMVDAMLDVLETPSAEFAREFGRYLYVGPSDVETEGREVLAAMVEAIRGGA